MANDNTISKLLFDDITKLVNLLFDLGITIQKYVFFVDDGVNVSKNTNSCEKRRYHCLTRLFRKMKLKSSICNNYNKFNLEVHNVVKSGGCDAETLMALLLRNNNCVFMSNDYDLFVMNTIVANDSAIFSLRNDLVKITNFKDVKNKVIRMLLQIKNNNNNLKFHNYQLIFEEIGLSSLKFIIL